MAPPSPFDASSSETRADFLPTASLDVLKLRAELLRKTRAFFDEREFLEVETPLLSHDTVVDEHLDPISVPKTAIDANVTGNLWLQTSPEFAMKRLLAAGAERIYQITHAFRVGERGRLHNPEFTMLEWYRVGDSYQQGIHLLSELASFLLGAGVPNQVPYDVAFHDALGIHPHSATLAEFEAVGSKLGANHLVGKNSRDDWLHWLMSEAVERTLNGTPTILFDYPASQAALARIRADDYPVAERFELYWKGIELANGYHELLDSNELESRNRVINERRVAQGKPALPNESRLLAAMKNGLPACCGVALGFDRVAMLLADVQSIDQVIPFPIERA